MAVRKGEAPPGRGTQGGVMLSWVFVLFTVALTVYGQLMLKVQVLKAGVLPGNPSGNFFFFLKLLSNPWVLSCLGAAFLASLCWMAAMTKLPLSRAYPWTSLSFIGVLFLGAWLLNEPITWPKAAGLALVIAGLILGSRG